MNTLSDEDLDRLADKVADRLADRLNVHRQQIDGVAWALEVLLVALLRHRIVGASLHRNLQEHLLPLLLDERDEQRMPHEYMSELRRFQKIDNAYWKHPDRRNDEPEAFDYVFHFFGTGPGWRPYDDPEVYDRRRAIRLVPKNKDPDE
ncbi:MAG TPA: hypothetical protein VK971_03510 [Thiohalobacter sp.]|nr:hypothetical protein [Thiohalobacter sp.]